MSSPRALLFSTESYTALSTSVAKTLGTALQEVERKRFPDGERYLRIEPDVRGAEVVLIGGTVSDADTLELYDIASGLVHNGAAQLTLVIPYFGYGTMERAARPGEVVTAKTRARLLSSIPLPPQGANVVLLDLHSEGLPFYFEGNLRPIHLYAKSVILEAIRSVGIEQAVLACTDAGRAKWVESLANDLGISAGFVFKRRLDGSRTEVAAVSAQVQGRHVILYDDMVRTGSSLLGAARAFLASGATRVSAIVTHGLLPESAVSTVLDSGVLEILICTDSHPRALEVKHPKLRVVSVAALLADFLRRATPVAHLES